MAAQPICHDDPTGVPGCCAEPAAPAPVVRVVWPDRDHAVVGVAGTGSDPRWWWEVRDRVHALMAGGVRYLLVDLTEARSCDHAAPATLADAAVRMRQRDGWLRVHRVSGGDRPPCGSLREATLQDLFAIYRALDGVPRP